MLTPFRGILLSEVRSPGAPPFAHFKGVQFLRKVYLLFAFQQVKSNKVEVDLDSIFDILNHSSE